MKTISVCVCFMAIYYVVGILGNSSKKMRYDEAEDKTTVTSKKDSIKGFLEQLLCEALQGQRRRSSDAKLNRRTAIGEDQLSLLNPYDFHPKSFFGDVRCRPTRPPSSSSASGGEDEDVDGRSQVRRQVDSMHSCIEAKCSGSSNYYDCVLRNCISAYQLGIRRLLATKKRRAAPRVFGQTEQIGRGGGGGEGRGGEGKREQKRYEDSGLEAEDLVSPSSSVAPDERRGGGGGEWGIVDRISKRGFNDIADVCVQHHCGSLFPHSMNFFSCVESHCVYRR